MIAKDYIELDWLKRWANYSPKSIALQDADSKRALSYREIYERSARLATNLKIESGIQYGDRVAVLAANEIETIILFFALQRIGAILVPINFRLSSREVAHVVNDCEPKILFYQNEFAASLEKLENFKGKLLSYESDLLPAIFAQNEAAPLSTMETNFESICMILYTSGTTGAPKGAMLSNKMLFWNSINTGLRLNLTQKDSTLIFHPLFHTSGWNVLTTPILHHGGRIIFLKKFDAEKVLQLAEAEKISILFGVPTMMDMMAKTPKFNAINLQSLRYAIVGGEPMPVELIRVWEKKGVPIRQGYGLTEFGPNVFSLNEEDSIRKIGSIGFPNFYIECSVLNQNSVEAKANEVGELLLRGPMSMSGYWKNAKATEETYSDSWLKTGDLVRRDEEGYFYIVGRKKDMFISGAENIYPAEVESYLRTHPKIHEVAVVGVKDERWGEVGKAFLSTQPGAALNENEIREFCAGNLAKYKIPKYFIFLPELPKSESGKILKRALQ